MFSTKKKKVIQALPKLWEIYAAYLEMINHKKKELIKEYGSDAGDLYYNTVFIDFKYFIKKTTGCKIPLKEIKPYARQ